MHAQTASLDPLLLLMQTQQKQQLSAMQHAQAQDEDDSGSDGESDSASTSDSASVTADTASQRKQKRGVVTSVHALLSSRTAARIAAHKLPNRVNLQHGTAPDLQTGACHLEMQHQQLYRHDAGMVNGPLTASAGCSGMPDSFSSFSPSHSQHGTMPRPYRASTGSSRVLQQQSPCPPLGPLQQGRHASVVTYTSTAWQDPLPHRPATAAEAGRLTAADKATWTTTGSASRVVRRSSSSHGSSTRAQQRCSTSSQAIPVTPREHQLLLEQDALSRRGHKLPTNLLASPELQKLYLDSLAQPPGPSNSAEAAGQTSVAMLTHVQLGQRLPGHVHSQAGARQQPWHYNFAPTSRKPPAGW